MRTDRRILLTMFLILGVMVGTNLLFPPLQPDPAELVEEPAAGSETATPEAQPGADTEASAIEQPADAQATDVTVEAPQAAASEEFTVETPLYTARFSTLGATLRSMVLPSFESFTREGGVALLYESAPMLGNRIVFRQDTLDTRGLVFAPTTGGSVSDIRLDDGDGAQTVTLRYDHPTQPFWLQVAYTFEPDSYVIGVEGRVSGVGDAVLLTDLGDGIPINEVRPQDDRAVLGFVSKNTRSGIEAERLDKVEELTVVPGPLDWVAFKSKYFVAAAVAPSEAEAEHVFGGAVVGERIAEDQLSASFAQAFAADGGFGYRLYLGPQERSRLVAVGSELENVNPYGWAFLRPIIRPFTGIITKVLIWMHESTGLAYGWVLMIFGVLLRVIMFPLYQKAMRAQMKNMAAQPRLKEIQTRYKDKPEQLQKEMMKLYKEEGFNPLAGCLPMLLPWPVLVALFFVFQNTIELRGVPFLWLPDLSAADPLYILPIFLGVSMFLLQFISIRSIPDANPQMKMMMWIFPVVFTVMFANFASGLNLYYATMNVAMLPQQYWIAQERKQATAKNKAKQREREAAEAGADAPQPAAAGAGSSKSKTGKNKKRKRRHGRP